jgi:hypothetical protein
MKRLRFLISLVLIFVVVFCHPLAAWGFCGFYVAKADAKLYNKASQVVIARSGDRTVLTMANDYQGDVKDFAVVIPVPTVLQKEQVRVGNSKILERLDAFSAPRLVEYFDPDPCALVEYHEPGPLVGAASSPEATNTKKTSNLGVTVEARFSAGEYDIVILSAKESDGLETWLVRNGYKIPKGAKQLLKPYIRQKMKFFVAKVNLDKFEETGYQYLRPLQITYRSPRFMLPIRLGMVNATTEQDLIVYILSQGQAELTNYRTVKIPSDVNIPLFVKKEFGRFYKSLFQTAYEKEGRKVAFLEYAWDVSNCDPCSAEPLNREELEQAGVFWLDGNHPSAPFLTRLHVRYTRDKFPEDLIFQQTSNQENFQGRYILQHPFTGEIKCRAGRKYKRSLAKRFEEEAQTLAKLTNWNIQDIRKRMQLEGQQSTSAITSW